MPEVLILAGGMAMRLKELSRYTPKSLIPIGGVPFIFHQLRLLKKNNIDRVVLCVGHMGEQIERAVGDGVDCGLNVVYSHDGPSPLGTGGAIAKALSLLSDNFMTLYGDSYLDVDYVKIFQYFLESAKLGLMTVYKNQNRYDKSNVIFEDGEVKLYDKKSHVPSMEYVDYGLTCFNKTVFENVPVESFDLSDVLHDLSVKRELSAFEIKERFYEIGSVEGIRELENHVLIKSRM
jgi:NDP-sugar pyrophosphorylase family protein